MIALLSLQSHGSAASPCPPEAGRAVSEGWRLYRAGAIGESQQRFTEADRLCEGNLDAKVGLGYARLRLGAAASAESLFAMVARSDPDNGDAWEGLALAADRQGHRHAAIVAARELLRLRPEASTARRLLDLNDPEWDRPRRARPARPERLRIPARTHGTSFQVASSQGWRDFYVQGVNLGVALPGRFPSGFPQDSAVYARWLGMIANMNANTIRVYTILPPSFYRALRGWNERHANQVLWLVHGVWTELPPGADFEDSAWQGEFRAEMERVVDVLHGAATLPPRPGHAVGRYDADVSDWTLAVIIGREWEPYAIQNHDARHPGSHGYRGRYLSMPEGSASEAWMTAMCDHMLSYDVDTYNAIRPIAFTNWPTLDPLSHPTESNVGEERVWRLAMGRPAHFEKLEYDNDAVGLDASRIQATGDNPAGWFASYHAYPYYPDFMLYDPGYNRAASSLGPSNYFGYLSELRRHHAGIPFLIAEYGVPSSRGIAHMQPQGWHHGGHDERAMAEVDVRLTREIRESGAAGGILFAWLDEWFKQNWVVTDLQIPPENTPRWHNAMNAEQHYGIVAMVAGDAGTTPELGGDAARWRALPVLERAATPVQGGPVSVRIGDDPAYVYLAVELAVERGSSPWDSVRVAIALDTYRADLGQHRLPFGSVASEVGFEFLVDLRGPSSGALRITPDYNPFAALASAMRGDERGAFYHRPVRTSKRTNGVFERMDVITNRARIGRDGRLFPAIAYDRGALRYGTHDASTLSDWFYDADAGLLEVRLPWGLLNVSDPSSRTVLYERRARDGFGTAASDGFRIGVITYRAGRRPELIGALPPVDRKLRWAARDFTTWSWPGWREPAYHERLKPLYHSLRELWADAHATEPVAPPRPAASRVER